MAINCYTGLQGSGKSYEVVSEVIVPAIAQGRRVVTNVEGISEEKIHAYLETKGEEAPEDGWGSIVHVTNDQVMEPNFWYYADDGKHNEETVVQPGDMVAIDEAWRFFSVGGAKLDAKSRVMIFLREHRHFTHEKTGVSCDLVLMTQDVGDLQRGIKHVIEMTTRTVKLKALGLHKAYRIELYEGYRLTKGSFITSLRKKYNPEIFPLYQSYKNGNGTEQRIDDRQNIWRDWKTWASVVGAPIGAIFLGWQMFQQFTPEAPAKPAAAPAKAPAMPTIGADGKPVLPPLPADLGALPPGMRPPAGATYPNGATRPPAANTTPRSQQTTFSPSMRVLGFISINGSKRVYISDAGQLRLASPSQGSFDGVGTLFTIDGEKVTPYSGGSSGHAPSSPANLWSGK